jgi:hypothetical protein
MSIVPSAPATFGQKLGALAAAVADFLDFGDAAEEGRTGDGKKSDEESRTSDEGFGDPVAPSDNEGVRKLAD